MKPNFNNSVAQRIRPLWPLDPLIPLALAPCPHGVWIRPERICIVCYKAAQPTQDVIDAILTPPPENPEDRALSQITYFRDWLASHPNATRRMRLYIMLQINRLEHVVREWIPTRYLPRADLKGGRS